MHAPVTAALPRFVSLTAVVMPNAPFVPDVSMYLQCRNENVSMTTVQTRA